MNHCSNEIPRAKNHYTESTHTKTLQNIFEDAYYNDKYIFFEDRALSITDIIEILPYLGGVPKKRLAGIFIYICYTTGSHIVCMIETEEYGPMIYDSNEPSGIFMFEYINTLFKNIDFRKIYGVAYVYSPEKFHVDWRKD